MKIKLSVLCIGLFLTLFHGTAEAQFVIDGFGISGSETVRDTLVEQGDNIYVLLTVQTPEGWTIDGAGLQDESADVATIYFYSVAVPIGNPSNSAVVDIDTETLEINQDNDPPTVSFKVRLPEVLALNLRSLQMVVSVYGRDELDSLHYSDVVTSFIDAGEYVGVDNPIDDLHASYLDVDRSANTKPTITAPLNNERVGRLFTVAYSQPLTAQRHTLTLVMLEYPYSGGPTITHRLFLTDSSAGENKELTLNSLNLGQSDGVDSISGNTSLNHLSDLDLFLFYRLAGSQGEWTDSAAVVDLRVDLLTDTPTLTEPRLGSESPIPEVRVIYRLPEPADTVQLTFTSDSLSLVEDPFSPHIITLETENNGAGEHYLVLDGGDIGENGRHVLISNNGPEDELVSQVIYNVTLSYGDELNNPQTSVTNSGYIWPEDLTTLPPRIIAPTTNTKDNSSFWVQFELPEVPLQGSVYLSFTALPEYAGSPHIIYLGGLAAGGVHSLFLNGQALDMSGPPVTSVQGGNSFVDGSRYFIRVAYQDHLGNDEAESTARLITYDNSSEPPTILSPVDGDTLTFGQLDVTYSQPEPATGGTVKITFEQTGGPEVDLFSPHILYLTDAGSGAEKTVTISPAFLESGAGVDSVHNPGTLVARGLYRMTLSYQDQLLNPAGSVFVRNLMFPSGSTVTINGSTLGTAITPGATNVPLIQFGLMSDGGSALRGLNLSVEGSVVSSDVIASRMILWSSVDSLLQTELDVPLDTLDNWYGGDMSWDSLSLELSEIERHVIVSGGFSTSANAANTLNLVLNSGTSVDCGGDPVVCTNCPVGMPDIALPVLVSSMFVEEDTTFTALVVNWIAESEHNVLGFRLWRTDDVDGTYRVVGSYSENEELYGRGNAATAKRYRIVDRNLRHDRVYTYSVDVVGMDGLSAAIGLTASGTPAQPPSDFHIQKIYPNPFNQETAIQFVVPFAETTTLIIYNILGQPVRELINAQLAPSVYRAHWNGQNDQGMTVPSGVYFVRLRAAGRFDTTQKILLIR
ncbi:MAG: T9SS type A sorting domain-containing protein [Calditrichaeota bacterium]|nr:T9SS type A sorting domain-containing protein [Calditrichota bacterium]